jgi:hypothetical protein
MDNLLEFYTRKTYKNELERTGVDACVEYLDKKVYVQALGRMISDIEHPQSTIVLSHSYPDDVKQWAKQTLVMHVVPVSEGNEMERLLQSVLSLRDKMNERQDAMKRLQQSVNDLAESVGVVLPKPTQ